MHHKVYLPSFLLSLFVFRIIPSGEVKDSNVCRVRADHQVGLTHTEEHRVSLCLGKGQQLLHCPLKKRQKNVKSIVTK